MEAVQVVETTAIEPEPLIAEPAQAASESEREAEPAPETVAADPPAPLAPHLDLLKHALLVATEEALALGIQRGQSLREAKSFGDLQSRRASPALSSSSFPANLTQNVTRYTEYGTINGGPTNADVAAANSGYMMNGREDPVFSSFANLSLGGFDRPAPRTNGRMEMNGDSHAGAIGSQRSHTGLNGNSNTQLVEAST